MIVSGDYFQYDDKTMQFSPGFKGSSTKTPVAYDSNANTCTNALKEIVYNVQLEAKDAPKTLNMGKKYYTIKKIEA